MTNATPRSPAGALDYSRTLARTAARRWPRNPYAHAALAYARRWPVRLITLWYVGFLAFGCWLVYQQQFQWHSAPRDRQRLQMMSNPVDPERGGVAAVSLTAVMAAFALPLLITLFGLAKELITDWRGTLVPHYRRPHLAFLAAFTATIVFLTAACFFAAAPFSVSTLLAANLGLAALAGWCATLPPMGAASVGIATVALFSLRPVRIEYEAMLFHQDPTGAALALMFTTLACAGVFVRLALVGESTVATRSDESLRLGQSLGFRRLTPHEHLATMPLRRRIALWRVPTSLRYLPAACAVGLLALIVGLCVTQDRGKASNAALAIPLACLSVVIPLMAVASQWTRRLPALGYELVRPTTRRAFVRDLGLAMALEWATWWLWLTAAGFLGIAFALLYSALLRHTPWANDLARPALTAVGTSAALQVLLYAALTWALRFQTNWAAFLTALAGIALAIFLFPYTLFHVSLWGPAATTAVILSVAALGLLLANAARHHWLRTDIR